MCILFSKYILVEKPSTGPVDFMISFIVAHFWDPKIFPSPPDAFLLSFLCACLRVFNLSAQVLSWSNNLKSLPDG